MGKYRYREDCAIERNDPNYPASIVLYDCDGFVVRRFDEDWTDGQIWEVLEFANQAYAQGLRRGEVNKANEIRKALLGV